MRHTRTRLDRFWPAPPLPSTAGKSQANRSGACVVPSSDKPFVRLPRRLAPVAAPPPFFGVRFPTQKNPNIQLQTNTTSRPSARRVPKNIIGPMWGNPNDSQRRPAKWLSFFLHRAKIRARVNSSRFPSGRSATSAEAARLFRSQEKPATDAVRKRVERFFCCLAKKDRFDSSRAQRACEL